MAHETTPHFHNTGGVPRIEIGAREFQCIGALPPFDHPHVFLDMGDEAEIVCPYCSTHFVFDPMLGHADARPAAARYVLALT
ncbi:MAG TPA: zinc-finger domain-containing protein [Devosiaceae bacterium]|nr:zinc-finger domain-containing protein [Devosiaceae bacterium]